MYENGPEASESSLLSAITARTTIMLLPVGFSFEYSFVITVSVAPRLCDGQDAAARRAQSAP